MYPSFVFLLIMSSVNNKFITPEEVEYLTQILFINTNALQIRASPILEKYHNSSDKLQTTAEQIKTEQYLTIFLLHMLSKL